MKKVMLILFLVSLCSLSWMFVIHDYKSGTSECRAEIERADELYAKKIYDEAILGYKKALKIRGDSKEALVGLAKSYFEIKEYSQSAEYAQKALKISPKETELALIAANAYENMSDYKAAFNVLSTATQTEEVKSRIKDIKSKYKLQYISIKKVSKWFSVNGTELSIAEESNGYSLYSAEGKKVMHGAFSYLGIPGDDGLFPCVDEGKWCFVDIDGKRRLVPETDYDYLGPFCDGFAVAKKGDTYGYIDKELQEYAFEYEKAYNFSSGQAPVIKESKVSLVDNSFAVVAASSYKDVVSDEGGNAVFDGILIANEGDKYILCNNKFAPLGTLKADKICTPCSTCGIFTYSDSDRYGFVSKTGKVEREPLYFDSKSYSNGLCAVKISTKWGYIDKNFDVLIEEKFDFAGDFSSKGTAWILNEAGYALLSLYVF